MRNPSKALASLDQLVSGFPNSRYMDEAQFRRGEIVVRRARPNVKSQAAYEAVIKTRLQSSAYYNQSLYKHGWSLFKQGENERSLDSFAERARLGAGVEERSRRQWLNWRP